MTRDDPTPAELMLIINAMKEATALQAKEYERRLALLNHDHARARETLSTYVPRELFDSYVKDQNARSEALALAVTLAQGETTGKRLTIANLYTGLGAIFAMISIAVTILIATR